MGRKVLVVDDEKLIVKGLRFSLEQDDMEVDCAYDGEEAQRLLLWQEDADLQWWISCCREKTGLH